MNMIPLTSCHIWNEAANEHISFAKSFQRIVSWEEKEWESEIQEAEKLFSIIDNPLTMRSTD